MTTLQTLVSESRRGLLSRLAPTIAGFAALVVAALALRATGLRESLDYTVTGGIGFGVFVGVTEYVRQRVDAGSSWSLRSAVEGLLKGVGAGMLFAWLLSR